MNASAEQLPPEILQRADVRHGEFAWKPSDIPAVIEAARCANLANLGGDLQIRAPSGFWGEPVGVGVDTARIPNDAEWTAFVEDTARAALDDFRALQEKCDFEAIARDAFPTLLAEVADSSDVIFFRWCVLSEEADRTIERSKE